MKRFRALVWTGLLFLLGAGMGRAQAIEHHTQAAHRLMELFNAADHDRIQTQFSPAMRQALPPDKAATFFEGLRRRHGRLEKLGPPRFVPPATIFPAHFERGTLDLKLVLDAQLQITGLWFQPHSPVQPPPETHQTELSLPFKGRWLVFWGGDTREQNYHHDVPNQRFALDLLGADEKGRTRRGAGRSNADYHAYGRELLAPADGTVLEVIDGVRDNPPGSMNPYSAVGNCVLIQHREQEVSVLAHFQPGSIRVKAGDQVTRGQVLGLCGNSGNSSEPHLHYHLQHAPLLQDGVSIKPVFARVVVTRDGQTRTNSNYSPVKGDRISPE